MFFFAGFLLSQKKVVVVLAWPPSPAPFSDSLQGMNSDSDGVQVIETKILNDKEWIESLDPKERQEFESNLVSFEELEDKKVVCTSCFTQGNHKQKVRLKIIISFLRIKCSKTL